MLFKLTIREIKNSIGRYLAILAIVSLGAAFFSGLRITERAMIATGDKYLKERNFFDYKIVSPIGYNDEDIKNLSKDKIFQSIEGGITKDIIAKYNEKDIAINVHKLPSKVNKIKIKNGRMPKNGNECIVDSRYWDKGNIGDEISISEHNEAKDSIFFKNKKYKIVGTCISPIYMNNERGSTNLLNGKISAFIYINGAGFSNINTNKYTEIYGTIDTEYPYFSDKRDDDISDKKEKISKLAENTAAYKLYGIKSYVDANENHAGYKTFANNAQIVSSISKVFPLFFILVSMLVAMTTMTRMVDAERTEIGIMKALGYKNIFIICKYLLYAISAGIIGAISGFFIGIKIFPKIIWNAYTMIYDFNKNIIFIFDKSNFLGVLIVVILCMSIATILPCMKDLSTRPAMLIRPKAPKSGKKILIERMNFLWKRFGFLYKVSIRNVFRNKKLLIMMVLGISGSMALLVAGFGIDTTISNIAKYQYDEIMKYDYQIAFKKDMLKKDQIEFKKYAEKYTKDIKFIHESNIKIKGKNASHDVIIFADDGYDFNKYINLHNGESKIQYPKENEIIISKKLAKKENLKKGDKVTLVKNEYRYKVKVINIADNFVSDYAYISTTTYKNAFGEEPEKKFALICDKNGSSKKRGETLTFLSKYKDATGNVNNKELVDRVDKMMESLNQVVITVIICAGLLAFIVIYNLTNINITERKREIATIKVLGFTRRETALYIFRENFIMTIIGIMAGIPMGIKLLNFIIDQIDIDMIFFEARISKINYMESAIITLIFAIITSLLLHRRIKEINMAESLKQVE